MNISLKPQTQSFVEEQLRSGRFQNASEVLEEALGQMMAADETELDDATATAINRAEEQLDRGEGIAFEDFAAKMRTKMAAK